MDAISRPRPQRLLAAFLTLLLALGTVAVVSASPASASVASDESTFLALLNQTRASHGKPPLTINSALSDDARRWSQHMVARNSLYHTPKAQMTSEVARVVPGWRLIGENIGYAGSVKQLHDALYASKGHRDNMLGSYTHVGIGVAHRGGQVWVTFRFVSGTPVVGSASTGGGTAGFPDVPSNAYYATPVKWLVGKKITTGVGDTGLFMPGEAVNRAQMATFLWRLAGALGEPAGPRFADVPSNAYYANAVAWLRARGITSGVGGSNYYKPNDPVTREQMAAFLHRFAGEKLVTAGHGFRDVARTSYADAAIRWLVRYDITTGTGPSTYAPHAPVTRGQMATFLHRLAGADHAFTSAGVRIP